MLLRLPSCPSGDDARMVVLRRRNRSVDWPHQIPLRRLTLA